VPTIDLPDDELAAVTAVIRRAIEGDRYPHAPRLDVLKAALARLEAASGQKTSADSAQVSEPSKPALKALPPAKADKRAKGSKATAAKAPAPKISPGFKLGRLPPDRKP
jgi:hypothetical protein